MDSSICKWLEQDYDKIKADCLKNKKLFVDPKFTNFIEENRDCEVKRPTELCQTPQFFPQDISRLDIQQGELGDCWLVAAIVTLSQHPKLLERVVPMDQPYNKDYAGIFRFRFWKHGGWVEVVVDDRLLIKGGQEKFARSTKSCEYWIALVEKAYAKLYGSYKMLEGGDPGVAMEDLTGGISEQFCLANAPSNLFNILYQSSIRESLLTASIYGDGREKITPLGLVKKHAYSITKVHVVEHTSLPKKAQLLRIKNPWANKMEWKGPWSDRSPQWNAISSSEKQELGLVFENDGEFWISFEDFQEQFTAVNICHITLESLFGHECGAHWYKNKFEDSFKNKKKFVVTLSQPDEGDPESKCSLIVALVPKSLGRDRSRDDHIAIHIYDKDDNVLPPDPSINSRDVVQRHKLPPGRYTVEPRSNGTGDYLLHIYTEQRHDV
ncbi:calpain-A-like [Rhynchophorus ferrugineus]|uniref:calpain-A-like n=1 Tax=Rhynchophorus ferrugineus TaxID=354439 RepID=UPI003FCD3220